MTAPVLSLAGMVVNLSNEVPLIGLLGDVAIKVEDLRKEGLTGSPIEILLRILRAPADDFEVASALRAVGLDGKAQLFAKLAEAEDRIEKAGGGFFLERMSNFVEGRVLPTSHDWELLDVKTETSLAGIGIDLKAKLALRFAALPGKNPFADEPAEDAWTFSDTPGEYLLTVTANGAATAAANLAVPFKFGKLGVAGSADGKAELAWLFDPPDSVRSQPIAMLLAPRIARLPNPFSLQSISAAMDDGDLVGLRMSIGGETEVAASVTIGYLEELAPGLKLTGGAEVSATSQLATTYHLTAKAERPRLAGQGHAIRVKVSRNSLNEKEIEFGLGVELDMAGLTKRIREIVMAKAGLLSKELEAIRPFLSPGTWARNKLVDKLGAAVENLAVNPTLETALQQDVAALVGIGRAGGLANFLEEQLASLLDRAGTIGETVPDEVARQLMGSLRGPLAALANEAAAKNAIQTELVSLIQQIRDKLEAEAKALTGAPLRKLSEAIEKAGATVNAGTNAADEAAKGLCKLFGNIETLVEKIAKEAENPLRTQVKLKIAASESRYRAQELQLEGVFNATNEETEKLYRAIWTGDWKQLSNLFTPQGVPGFEMEQDTSSLVLTMGSTRNASVHAVVLGFGMEFTAKDIAEAEVEIDGFGNITVLATAEVKKHRKLFGEAKGAYFTSAFAIAAMANGTSGLKSADMGFAFESRDKKMKRKEVARFLHSLDALSGAGHKNMVAQVLDEWFGKGEGAAMDGLIACRSTLSRAQVLRLADLGRRVPDDLALRVRLVQLGLDLGRRLKPDWKFRWATSFAKNALKKSLVRDMTEAEIWQLFFATYRIDSPRQLKVWTDSEEAADLFVQNRFGGGGRTSPIDAAGLNAAGGAVVRALTVAPFMAAIARTVDAGSTARPETLTYTLGRVHEEQQEIVRQARAWISIGDNVQELASEKVAERPIMFLLILNDLVSDIGEYRGEPLDVSVSMTKSSDPEKATSFSFPISGVAGGVQ